MAFTNKYWLLWTTDSIATTQSIETVAWSTVTKFSVSGSTLVTGSSAQFSKNIWYSVQDTGTTHSIDDPNGYEMFSYLTVDPTVYGSVVINPHFGNELQTAYCTNGSGISSSIAPNTYFAVTQEEANEEALFFANSNLHCNASLIPNLLWQFPALTPPPPPVADFGGGVPGRNWTLYYGDCALSSEVSASIPGDSDVLYNINCRIRGVTEYCGYTGGTTTSYPNTAFSTSLAHVNVGGTYTGVPPVYQLIVSSPSKTFNLNHLTGSQEYAIAYYNYEFSFQAHGGSTISLSGNSGDYLEVYNDSSGNPNHTPYVWNDLPPIQVEQPYLGQFLQLDINSIDPA